MQAKDPGQEQACAFGELTAASYHQRSDVVLDEAGDSVDMFAETDRGISFCIPSHF